MTNGRDTRAYLIAGAGGMLGTALQRVLTERGATFVAPPEAEFDITHAERVNEIADAFAEWSGGRGVLLNAAAYTNVEKAEDEPELAHLVNEGAPALLARACRRTGLGFVHVSTDFVFDGEKDGPYVETDEPNPLSVYGASKLAGEIAVAAEFPDALIVRTAWVYGPPTGGFPAKIMAAAERGGPLRVVTDEIGSPTYTPHLAEGILGLVAAGASGVFHLAGGGSCTRYELATEVLRLAGLEVEIEPVTSDAFPTKAARPKNSVLDCGKAAGLGVELPGWGEGLAEHVLEIG